MHNKSWFKKTDGLVAAFFIPLVAMFLIFIQRGIFPFGDESFLRTDMYHQYAPFFSEFKHKLSTGGSLLYTWNIGMGINFSALYAYYLASPLNWLVAVVPKDFVLEFMTYMIVLKIALSGWSFSYYLSRHGRKEKAGIAFFGTFYALSGYMAAYSWNIMWLDCIFLFPLICLGLERLIFNKKGILYAVTLGLSILSNYYISIMICLFMMIYFLALMIIKRKKDFKDIFFCGIRFAFYSLIAGAFSAVVLLPEVYALQDTASGDFNFPKTFSQYFGILDMFARHMPGVKTEIGLDHWPNIYCGVAVFIFIVLYALNKKIAVKEKIIYSVMILFFFASFSIDVLNYIWHGLHYPNSLPARQSFIYIFLILYICYRAYYNFNWNSISDVHWAGAASIGFVILAQKFVTEDHFSFGVFYASMILVALYTFLLHAYKQKKLGINLLFILTAALVFIEATLNTGLTSVSTVGRSDYMDDNAAVENVLESVPLDQFYRIEKVNRKTKNDGAWMNFKTASLFSSTARADLSDFFREMGCESSTNAYSITGSTPLVDMFLAIRYGLYTGESNIPDLNLIAFWDNIHLYENPYTLPLGFMVGPDFESVWDRSPENPADVQNGLAQTVGVPNVLIEETGFIENSSSYRFTASADGQYYVFVTNANIENVRAANQDTGTEKNFEHVNRRFLLDLGYLSNGTSMLVSNSDGKPMDMVAYRFDMEALSKVHEMLNVNPMQMTYFSDTRIEAEVSSGENEVLMTTIPYDKGWKVMLDGMEVEAREGIDAFLAVDIAASGSHQLVFTYMPQGLIPGAYVTAGSILLLLLIYGISLLSEFRKRRKKKGAASEAEGNVAEHKNQMIADPKHMGETDDTEDEGAEEEEKKTDHQHAMMQEKTEDGQDGKDILTDLPKNTEIADDVTDMISKESAGIQAGPEMEKEKTSQSLGAEGKKQKDTEIADEEK